MTVTNDQGRRAETLTRLEMPCPLCEEQGERRFFLPRGWKTAYDLLVDANTRRQEHSRGRSLTDLQATEQAWHDMQVAWAIAEDLGIVQEVGTFWCDMARSGFNNIIGGRVGDSRQKTPIEVPQGVNLYGHPGEITFQCPRCRGRGVLHFPADDKPPLTPEQVEVIRRLESLGEERKEIHGKPWRVGDPAAIAARAEALRPNTGAIVEACHRGAELKLNQELMAFALKMSRAGLIDIMKAGRRS